MSIFVKHSKFEAINRSWQRPANGSA